MKQFAKDIFTIIKGIVIVIFLYIVVMITVLGIVYYLARFIYG